MISPRFPTTTAACLLLGLSGLLLLTLTPADAAPPTARQRDPAGGTQGIEPAEQAVNQKAEALLERIHQLNRKPIEGETREEQIRDYSRNQREIVRLASQLFAESVEDPRGGLDYAAVAVQATVRGLRELQQLSDPNAKAELTAFVKMLVADKRPTISQFAKRLQQELKYDFALDARREEVEWVAGELKKDFAQGQISDQDAALILQVLMLLEYARHADLARDLNLFFAARFAESENQQIASYSERLRATAKRLGLLGKPIEVSGTFLDGSQVDWDAYRGKVVLLDYWATWCEPCINEIPNLRKIYEIYHDRGFEVIGISVDEDREMVEKFVAANALPWKTLFSDDPAALGWNHPMAKRYGVGSLPIVILVDKQGKVVSLDARGEELGRLLAELIGPPE